MTSADAFVNQFERKPKPDAKKLAQQVVRQPDLLDSLLKGINSTRANIKYGCCKVLRVLSDDQPDLLYPHCKTFVALLDHDNNILKWEGIYVLGRLAAIDRNGRITRLMPRLRELLNEKKLITAANTAGALAKIAQAKPHLTDQIIEDCIARAGKKFETSECRQVFIGQVLEAFGPLYDQSRSTTSNEPLHKFAQKAARTSTRPSTKKKAQKLLTRIHSAQRGGH